MICPRHEFGSYDCDDCREPTPPTDQPSLLARILADKKLYQFNDKIPGWLNGNHPERNPTSTAVNEIRDLIVMLNDDNAQLKLDLHSKQAEIDELNAVFSNLCSQLNEAHKQLEHRTKVSNAPSTPRGSE